MRKLGFKALWKPLHVALFRHRARTNSSFALYRDGRIESNRIFGLGIESRQLIDPYTNIAIANRS